ncbi:MAG: hypothetical protein NC299_03975 [Lachnospiraceae bacterium]|nr:hypothetical protein [Ruminococcus sp.]MCM1274505.1 hypothetical protein [Lachnospiraceae bacterium]
MTQHTKTLVNEILDAITRRYVLTGMSIPADVLALKDETMDIFSKAMSEKDPEKMRLYEARIDEIHATILPRG